MKRLLQKQRKYPGALLLTLALTLAAFAARADRLTAVRTYDTSAVRLGTRTAPDGTEFRTVEWGDMHPAAEVGSPELPVEHFRFLVPVYSNNFRATVVSATGASALPLGSRVLPAQIPQKADGSPAPAFTYPKAAAYVRTLAPEAWVVDDGFIDGCNHVVTVAVRPVSYDDATLSASAYGSVTVRLDYDLCGEDGLTGSKPIFPPRASEYVRIEDLVVNTANVAQFAPRRVPDAGSGEHSRHYYIIVPDNLKDAVDDLAVWKRQKGYSVVVKTIEDICATPRYVVGGHCSYRNGQTEELVDSAASLRAYLHDEFEDNGAFFCLLVGNSKTSMPIRKAYNVEDGKNHTLHPSNNKYFTPTDSYFYDLTKNYSLSLMGITPSIYSFEYSDSQPILRLPSIYVGRLLASNKNDIYNYTKKLILYESNPGRGNFQYLDSAFFFEQYQPLKESLMGDSEKVREISDKFIPSLVFPTIVSNLIADGKHPTGRTIINQLKKYGLSSWHAHGSPFGFGTAANRKSSNPNGSFYVTSEDKVTKRSDERPGGIWDWQMNEEDGNGLDNLNNKDFPSVVYSISCDNTPFDIMYENYDAEWQNLGESFTCGEDYGGPAFLGNTRVGYINYSADLEVQFFKSLNVSRKLGIMEAISKVFYASEKCSEHLILTHNLIGDPEFEIWLGKPRKFEDLKISNYGLKLSGSDLPGVKTSIYYGNGESIWTECSSSSTELHKSAFRNDYTVSVWKTDHLPIITLYSLEGTISNETKKYIVQTATLGNPLYADKTSGTYKTTTLGYETSYTVYASENITAYPNFVIEDGAEVLLDCDKAVDLSCTVKAGGKLTVIAKDVRMNPDFNVEKGAIFTTKTE